MTAYKSRGGWAVTVEFCKHCGKRIEEGVDLICEEKNKENNVY